MRYSEGRVGRVFVVRLEDGDRMPDAIEAFAQQARVARGLCILIGGIREGGRIVVGPEDGSATPVVPMLFSLTGVHEILGVGTLLPDEAGRPRLHMHAALGRGGATSAGCIRPGIEVWKLGEAVLLEITDNTAQSRADPELGFQVVEP
jgi:predicted DNA-binding protein with PD1-like motif